MNTEFDNTINKYIVTVFGTGFTPDDLTSVSLFIDDFEQNTIMVSATQAQFEIINMLTTSSSNVRLFCESGLCAGYDQFDNVELDLIYFQVIPEHTIPQVDGVFAPARRLQDEETFFFSSEYGTSAGGDCYRIRGSFGLEDSVQLYHVPTMQGICREVRQQVYGEAYCETIPLEIASTDELVLDVNGVMIGCDDPS